jgi:hypothetical protein
MCPTCNEPLIVVELEGVEVDYCPACHGTWLDTGELELITELAGGQPGPLHRALHDAGRGASGRRRCPRCRRKLRRIDLGTAPVVQLDRCPVGQGLWFDAGELATLVREYAGREEATLAHFFGDLFRHRLSGAAGAGPTEER